jgi:hypothetical protein
MSNGCDTLARANPHPRDARVTFVEDTHTYFVDGSSDGYISCTTLIHSLFGHFDADAVIAKMMASPRWRHSQYFGMTPDEIKKKWDENRDSAAAAGTAMHLNLERYYNFEEHSTEGREWEMFAAFRDDHPRLEAHRTEMIVFAEDLKIAGSIDMLYHDPDEPGAFIIADWKRSKEIKMSNRWQSGTHSLTEELEDCNFIHYSLQLSLYKYVLEKYYGMKVNDRFIVVLHPNQETYLKIPTRDMDDVIAALMDERRIEVASASPAFSPPSSPAVASPPSTKRKRDNIENVCPN